MSLPTLAQGAIQVAGSRAASAAAPPVVGVARPRDRAFPDALSGLRLTDGDPGEPGRDLGAVGQAHQA
jgi:hypothetical protein